MFVVDNCLPRGKAKSHGFHPIYFDIAWNFVSFRGIELGVTAATVQLAPRLVPRLLPNMRANLTKDPMPKSPSALHVALEKLSECSLPASGFEEGTQVTASKHTFSVIFMYATSTTVVYPQKQYHRLTC